MYMIYNFGNDKIKIYKNGIIKSRLYSNIFMMTFYISEFINYILAINILFLLLRLAKLFK